MALPDVPAFVLPPQPEDRERRHEQRVRTISDLTGADPSRIRTLASAFVKANDVDLQQLRRLHDNGDRLALRQLAHRIKGAAQMTGDAQLIAHCAELGAACLDPKASPFALTVCVRNMENAMREFGESCQRMAQDAAAPPA
ncbi:Hpt domain-containing protein [Achromobacter sp. NPDC008082]|uniref:Hpt domain-containing protein n=1 Tax=Achromobacter sp. NPDC008082 TaxID=3363888 RepID=UPI0036F08304